MIKTTARLSSDSQKKVEERRQQLKRSIEEKGAMPPKLTPPTHPDQSTLYVASISGGEWDERWVVDGVPRAAGVNSGRLDMYYISPDGKRMRSMSEVYQFLGLTTPALKSSRPVPMPQAGDAPRSSREAKIYATAAISASVANPYPVQHSPAGFGGKRPRPVSLASGPAAARPYLDMEVRLALENPDRWKEIMFPVDARSRASLDAYEVSLRQSCAAEWRRSHNTDVRSLAERVSAQLKESQQGMQAHAVRAAQHFKFLDDSVFPLMSELLAACEAAGVPTAEAKQAAAKMQSRHKDFAEASQRQSVEAATTQTRLTEELSRITSDVKESASKAARPAPACTPSAEAHAAASAAAAAAAAAVQAELPVDVLQTGARAAGTTGASVASGSVLPRAGRRPTPAIGSAAARVNEAAARAHAGAASAASPPRPPTAAVVMRSQPLQQHTTLAAANATGNGALPPMPNELYTRTAAATAPPNPAAGCAGGTPPQQAAQPGQGNGAHSPSTFTGSAKLNKRAVFGHASFDLAPEVTLAAPRGHIAGRLGNPRVCAHEDGTLWTTDGKQVPVNDAFFYLFSAKGNAGKFAGKNSELVKAEVGAKPVHLTEDQRNEALLTAGRRLLWSACVAEKKARQEKHRAASQNADAVMSSNHSKPAGPVPMQQ